MDRHPAKPAAVAASSTGSATNVYVSWNGATDVASWRVLAGPSDSALQPVVTGPNRGFESRLTIPAQPYVAVQALDAYGHALATSSTVRAQ